VFYAECDYAEYRYAECVYAVCFNDDCDYAECCNTLTDAAHDFNVTKLVFFITNKLDRWYLAKHFRNEL
jgi:hypothetical protein